MKIKQTLLNGTYMNSVYDIHPFFIYTYLVVHVFVIKISLILK